jgi:hypothetical protein
VLIYGASQNDEREPVSKTEHMMGRIGIVGGGIAGLYCALKLADKAEEVIVYESLDRLGGRIETVNLQGFKAECGPMRFELEIEPLFSTLAGELEIDFATFTPPRSGSAEFPKHDLQQNEVSAEHKREVEKVLGAGSHSEIISGIFSHHTSALDMLKFGIFRMFNPKDEDRRLSLAEVVSGGIESKISVYADSLIDNDYDRIRTTADLDSVLVYMMGFWNALSVVLSPGAIAKIRDMGTFYHLLPENPSASEWAIFWLRMFRSNAKLSTIKAGVDTVVEKLHAKLKDQKNLEIHLNATVEEIAGGPDGKVRLKIATRTKPEDFDHVILTIPAVPLRNLTENFPADIRTYVEGVIPFPLLKVFVVIEKPWWEELPEPQQGAHLVPTREVHYFPPPAGTTNRAMIMFYTDRPATAYWHPYIEGNHTKAQVNKTAHLKRELVLQVSRLLPRNGADEKSHMRRVEQSIVAFAIRDWSERPFGAACHAWAPKVEVPTALEQLSAFGLQGQGTHKNVHICGEAYSDYQGFIEGALRSAHTVLKKVVVD